MVTAVAMHDAGMTLEEFLARPLVARVAANGPSGPTVRPVWFLYEDGALWWLTASSYSRSGEWLRADPRVALTIDACDLATGHVCAVTASGKATVVPFDAERATRKLTKYLGTNREAWPERFRGTFDDPTSRFVTCARRARPDSETCRSLRRSRHDSDDQRADCDPQLSRSRNDSSTSLECNGQHYERQALPITSPAGSGCE